MYVCVYVCRTSTYILTVCLSVCLRVCLQDQYLHTNCLSVCMSVCLYVCVYVCRTSTYTPTVWRRWQTCPRSSVHCILTSLNDLSSTDRLVSVYLPYGCRADPCYHDCSSWLVDRPKHISDGSVAGWLACWTQVQKGLGSNHSRDAVG